MVPIIGKWAKSDKGSNFPRFAVESKEVGIYARGCFPIQVKDLQSMFPNCIGKRLRLLGNIFFLGKLGSLINFGS